MHGFKCGIAGGGEPDLGIDLPHEVVNFLYKGIDDVLAEFAPVYPHFTAACKRMRIDIGIVCSLKPRNNVLVVAKVDRCIATLRFAEADVIQMQPVEVIILKKLAIDFQNQIAALAFIWVQKHKIPIFVRKIVSTVFVDAAPAQILGFRGERILRLCRCAHKEIFYPGMDFQSVFMSDSDESLQHVVIAVYAGIVADKLNIGHADGLAVVPGFNIYGIDVHRSETFYGRFNFRVAFFVGAIPYSTVFYGVGFIHFRMER